MHNLVSGLQTSLLNLPQQFANSDAIDTVVRDIAPMFDALSQDRCPFLFGSQPELLARCSQVHRHPQAC